jgi:hypothetical protein
VEQSLTPVIGARCSISPCALHKFIWRRRCLMRLTLAQHIVTSLKHHLTSTTLSHRDQTPPSKPGSIWLLATTGRNVEPLWTNSHSRPQSMCRPAWLFDTTTSRDTTATLHPFSLLYPLPRTSLATATNGVITTVTSPSHVFNQEHDDVDVPQRLPPRLHLNRV